ncbi:hypothetical protein SAZ11_59800 [Streptomyces sp. FXJ1.4098]|uniref:hypothetical protein n=1 Tax=Streptomyces sp. NPDC020845 TaxID=3365096 RepID=UPI0029978A10|nr:hypothetical protein [Streptomyces sp. FXJ1.4098]
MDTFPHGSDVQIRYRSYQPMPHLLADHPIGLNELLTKERGLDRTSARRALDSGALEADVRQAGTLGIAWKGKFAKSV